ncbi:MAG: diaminopimelate epimerase [Sphingopyxis sp.]|nr:diaminopimelate epimerase [Sphingopyxis sp.]
MADQFIKMHGLGNDFVIFDARRHVVPIDAARAIAVADRRMGIGCDQVILIEPSTAADVRMRIWNADGSEVEACGNASRCVARLIGGVVTIETEGGLLSAVADGNSRDGMISVDYPVPQFGWADIPLAYAMDTALMPVAWGALEQPMAVNVGNPHIVFFVDDLAAIPLATLGPDIETDALFPERINVNVAQITGPSSLTLAVWERGAGLTRACGTGACATAVAAIRSGRVTGPVSVTLPGGVLVIDWNADQTITMRGTATEVFRGTIDLSRLA